MKQSIASFELSVCLLYEWIKSIPNMVLSRVGQPRHDSDENRLGAMRSHVESYVVSDHGLDDPDNDW